MHIYEISMLKDKKINNIFYKNEHAVSSGRNFKDSAGD